MEYEEIKDDLADFDKVLVSGPQRSGTRITTKIISEDLNYHYIDEENIHIQSVARINFFIDKFKKFVLQCPALSCEIESFSRKDVAIVFVVRDVDDILESQKRVIHQSVGPDSEQSLWYKAKFGVDNEIPSPIAKYKVWRFQKKNIINPFELDYNSLSDHELFVPKEKRKNFKWNQTSLE